MKTKLRMSSPHAMRKRWLSVLLALVMAMGYMPTMAWAEAGDEPVHSKNVTPNGDGTYTISLDVTGDADTEIDANKVNVIVAMDISGSMSYPADDSGSTRVNDPTTVGRFGYIGNGGNADYRRLYYRTGNAGNYSYTPEGTGDEATIRHQYVYYSNDVNADGAITWRGYNGYRYNFDKNDTRLDVTKNAVNNLIDTLLAQNTGKISDMIEISFITFSSYANFVSPASASDSGWTSGTNGTALKEMVNSTVAAGATNWDGALYNAKQLADAKTDGDKTFVVFFSDGEPTYHYGTAASDTNHTHNNTINGTGSSTSNADLNAAYFEAGQFNTDDYDLYGIFAYGTDTGKGYMQNLVNHGNGTTEGFYYSADNEEEVKNAFAAIATAIASAAGIAETSISDGTTEAVQTTTGEIAELLNVDESSYEYWLSWQMLSGSNKITMFIGGSEKEYTVTSEGDKVKIAWDDGEATYTGTYNGNVVKIKWEKATAFYDFDPPAAELKNGSVDWDLNSVNTLLDGVTYTVTFDVWPSQTTLDLIAKIKNDPAEYDNLDANIKKYLNQNGGLKTNTGATLTYNDTRTDDGLQSIGFNDVDPVSTTAVEQLAVSKGWENDIDTLKEEPVDLKVMCDGEVMRSLSLSDKNDWKQNVFISIGIMKTTVDGSVKVLASGHDFTFVEPEGLSYHWELDVPTVRPMLVNGELTMLIKMDDAHQPGDDAQVYKDPFGNGSDYFVGSTSEASLTATNYRRSSLILKKKVEGIDVPEDAIFPFTLNIVNANDAKAVLMEDGDDTSDHYVRFSVQDQDGNPVNEGVAGATPENGTDGCYYAESGTDITVDAKDGYNIRLNNLPKGSTYTITEGELASGFVFKNADIEVVEGEGTTETFKGGRVSTGTIESTNTIYEVTYTNQYRLIDINVDKVWDDNSNQDGKRPETLTLMLNGLPEGTTAPDPEIVKSEDGNVWTYIWKAVPRYSDKGKEISYTVTENALPEGYSCENSTAGDGGTIVNTHAPETTSVKATKVWNDNNNQDRKRTDITLHLMKKVGKSKAAVVKGQDKKIAAKAKGKDLKVSWENLPAYEGGQEIVYSVAEDEVPGYTTEITGNAKKGFTVTNSRPSTPEKSVYIGSSTTNIDGQTVQPGEELTYEIKYRNTTGKTAETVTITDVIPEHTSFVSADNGGTETDGTVTWTFSNVPNGETITVKMVVKVDENTGGAVLTNDATVNDGTNTYTTNVVTNTTSTDPVKDVFLESDPQTSIDGQQVQPGDKLAYTITYTNTTGETADATITDAIPAHTTFVSADHDGAEADGTVTWELKDVANGSSVTVGFIVQVDGDPNSSELRNMAKVVVGGNEYSTNEVVNPTPAPDPVKAVYDDKDHETNIDGKIVDANDTLFYTITYENRTSNDVRATITDQIPEHTSYVEDSADHSGSYADGVLTWNLKVKRGSAVTVSFKVAVDGDVDADTITNQAVVQVGNNESKTNIVTNPTTEKLLDTDNHYGYVIGYPEDYETGEQTEDQSRWPVKPTADITRAEVSTVFFRMLRDEKRAQYWTQENPFSDVSIEDWFNNPISVMTSIGILKGYEDGTFLPNRSITRAEMAAIAARFARLMGTDVTTESTFTDIDGHWAKEEIEFAASVGWVRGYPDGTYHPQDNITRAEFMTLANRMLERQPEDATDLLDAMIVWPDNADPGQWYYLAVQDATNSHKYHRKGVIVPNLKFEYEKWDEMLEMRDWSAYEKAWSDANAASNPGDVVEEDAG